MILDYLKGPKARICRTICLKKKIFIWGYFWSINNTSYYSAPVKTLKNCFLIDSLPPPLIRDPGIMHSV